MVDDSQQSTPLLPPPPIGFQIPSGTIDKWLAIPERAIITVPLTRQDVDNLFFAVTNIAQGVQQLQQTLLHYSHGRTDEANKTLAESQKRNTDGDNYMRMFMNALMAGAKADG